MTDYPTRDENGQPYRKTKVSVVSSAPGLRLADDAKEIAERMKSLGLNRDSGPPGLSSRAHQLGHGELIMSVWTLNEAMNLAVAIEAIAPTYNAHVALTGGLLYKPGPRKDADFLFYPHKKNGTSIVDKKGLLKALPSINLRIGRDFGRIVKATWLDKPIDFFFIDYDGDY